MEFLGDFMEHPTHTLDAGFFTDFDYEHTDPLIKAIVELREDDVCQLLENGADSHTQDDSNMTAFHYAINVCNTSILDALMPHILDRTEQDMLMDYATRDALVPPDAVRYLLDHSVDTSTYDHADGTLLHIAIMEDNVYRAAMLVLHGVDPTIRDPEGHNALMACGKVRCESLRRDFTGLSQLYDLLLASPIDVEARDAEGRTALALACENQHYLLIMHLYHAGAKMTTTDKLYVPPHLAMMLPQNLEPYIPSVHLGKFGDVVQGGHIVFAIRLWLSFFQQDEATVLMRQKREFCHSLQQVCSRSVPPDMWEILPVVMRDMLRFPNTHRMIIQDHAPATWTHAQRCAGAAKPI